MGADRSPYRINVSGAVLFIFMDKTREKPVKTDISATQFLPGRMENIRSG